MEIKIDSIVYCKHGEIELRMGKALTGVYFKGVEKFVFRTSEMKDLSYMIEKSLEVLKERDVQFKAEFDKIKENLAAILDNPTE